MTEQGQQPYPTQGPPPGGWAPPQKTGTNGLAIASLVLGIVSLGGLGSILALIFGFVGRSQIRRTGQGGNGLAIAGIVLGILSLIGWIVLYVALATHHGCVSTNPDYCDSVSN